MNTQMQDVIFETLCSAFYNMPFTRFLGENEEKRIEDTVAWFILSEHPELALSARQDPKQIKISIRRERIVHRVVTARVEWLNLAGATITKGEQTFTVVASESSSYRGAVEAATEDVVTKVLLLYRDVLEGAGLAGPIAETVKSEDESAGVIDPDTDMAKDAEDFTD